jgi:hypothetical protein
MCGLQKFSRQPAVGQRDMNHGTCAECGADFGRVQDVDQRVVRRQMTQLVTPAGGTVTRRNQDALAGGPRAIAQKGPHLFVSHHRLAGAARQTEHIAAAFGEHALQPIGEIGRHCNRFLGGAGKRRAKPGFLQDFAVGAEP